MRPLKRKPANKFRGAKKFRKDSARTKAVNMSSAPMRGGIRL